MGSRDYGLEFRILGTVFRGGGLGNWVWVLGARVQASG